MSIEDGYSNIEVSVPIRHKNLSKSSCLFDLKTWCLVINDLKAVEKIEYKLFLHFNIIPVKKIMFVVLLA